MNWHKILLVLLGLMVCAISLAQPKSDSYVDFKGERFEVFKHDSIESQYLNLFTRDNELIPEEGKRFDNLGNPVALLIIPSILENGVSFKGNIVGDVKYLNNSYYLYLSDGTHLLQIQTPSRVINIDLAELNDKVKSLEGGRVYYLCGLDNDFSNKTNHIEFSKGAKITSKLRLFAKQFINNSTDANVQYFKELAKMCTGKGWPDYVELLNKHNLRDENHLNVNLISVMQHGAKADVYGLTFEIRESTITIGYVFMGITDSGEPTLLPHIITYQSLDDCRENGIFTLDDFFIPL